MILVLQIALGIVLGGILLCLLPWILGILFEVVADNFEAFVGVAFLLVLLMGAAFIFVVGTRKPHPPLETARESTRVIAHRSKPIAAIASEPPIEATPLVITLGSLGILAALCAGVLWVIEKQGHQRAQNAKGQLGNLEGQTRQEIDKVNAPTTKEQEEGLSKLRQWQEKMYRR